MFWLGHYHSSSRRLPVRCKHDTEWPYVLDYSDDRSKDDIRNNVDTLAYGFANSISQRMMNGDCQWSS